MERSSADRALPSKQTIRIAHHPGRTTSTNSSCVNCLHMKRLPPSGVLRCDKRKTDFLRGELTANLNIARSTARCIRQNHRYTLTIFSILRMKPHQIPLLKLDCNKYVRSRTNCIHQMRRSHQWRSPSHQQPPHIQRMPHQPIWPRRTEFIRRIRLADQVQPHLTQSKQIEMVDQKGSHQYGQPTKSVKPLENRPPEALLDAPNGAPHWLPFPKQQHQRQTGK